MSITMNRYNGVQVTPLDDARLNQIVYVENGILVGCALSHLGANQVRINAGAGILKGRDYEVTQETLLVQLATSGTMPGRIYIKCDLANTVTPIQILSVCAATLPALVQNPNFNEVNGIWEEELATYTASTTAISGLTTKFKRLTSVVTPYITTSKTEIVPGKTIDATVLSEIFTTYLTSNLTLYVATTGNDTTGTGTSGNPYATILKALSVIPKNLNGYDVIINIAAGTYTDNILIDGLHAGRLYFNINGSVILNGYVTSINCSGMIQFQTSSTGDLVINNTPNYSNGAIYLTSSFMLQIIGIPIILNSTTYGIRSTGSCSFYSNNSVTINNANIAVLSGSCCSTSFASILDGTGNNIGLQAVSGSISYDNDLYTLSATTPVQKIDGGIITNELYPTKTTGLIWASGATIPTSYLCYKLGNMVHLDFTMPVTTGIANSSVVGELPIGFRPTVETEYKMGGYAFDKATLTATEKSFGILCKIKTNGQILIGSNTSAIMYNACVSVVFALG